MTLNQPGEHPEGLTDFQEKIMEKAESATNIRVLRKIVDLVKMGENFGGQWGDNEIKKVAMELEDTESFGPTGEYSDWSPEEIEELRSILTSEDEEKEKEDGVEM